MIVNDYTEKSRKGGNKVFSDELSNPVTYNGVTYDGDQRIGTGTAALIADRNRRTIINWCKKEYLPSLKVGGPRGQYSFTIADLVKVLTIPGGSPKPQVPSNADVAA
jgi:hypothetical protein